MATIYDKNGNIIIEKTEFSLSELLDFCRKQKISLKNANFKEQNLTGVDFNSLDLIGADFTNAILQYCDFQSSIISNAVFTNAVLKNAYMQDVIANETNFKNCSLQNIFSNSARFIDCDFSGADLRENNFLKTRITNPFFKNTLISNTIGDMENICSLQVEKFSISFNSQDIAIGCKQESISWWKNVKNEELNDGREDYTQVWNAYKDILFKIINIKYNI
ncbi:pentapeptide repeat-containing protein [Campylobacter sp. CNRCH_2014_2849]|uniref:pentapeptide repeat-containing protein n=1 Tax=Campylobacter sp. CNRCH_2014_2849 TaxID=2911604 RepID=UPI0021E67B5E|nr:pentapeptide repeat-containing protein [Campylobacter sp. CNRCH_2014_2849]MCV3473797.1 pentapeptide repeat-containing protein [Campylobacter sp. CNRCH_2014_2849]